MAVAKNAYLRAGGWVGLLGEGPLAVPVGVCIWSLSACSVLYMHACVQVDCCLVVDCGMYLLKCKVKCH